MPHNGRQSRSYHHSLVAALLRCAFGGESVVNFQRDKETVRFFEQASDFAALSHRRDAETAEVARELNPSSHPIGLRHLSFSISMRRLYIH